MAPIALLIGRELDASHGVGVKTWPAALGRDADTSSNSYWSAFLGLTGQDCYHGGVATQPEPESIVIRVASLLGPVVLIKGLEV